MKTDAMGRDEAYEMASQQGFEGHIFFTEQDAGVGRVDHVKIKLEDEYGNTSVFHAEVSEANGCESFMQWNDESEAFFRESIAASKKAKRTSRTK